MTSPKIEYNEIAALAFDRDVLINWVNEQVGPWRDGTWGKTYRRDTPLEWFNPPADDFYPSSGSFGHGIQVEWVDMGVVERIRNNNEFIIVE